MYCPLRVSILSTFPRSMKSGTWTSAPVSTLAGFVAPWAVFPLNPGSVSTTSSSRKLGNSATIGDSPCIITVIVAFSFRNRPAAPSWPPSLVSSKDWKPLRFVMVGDRYDKDVEPLVDLLEPGVGLTIRLRMGKYGHLHPEESIAPARRPGRTFTDWDSLAHLLTEELTPEQVQPITTSPDLADRQQVTRGLIEFGLQCDLKAVRCVAAVLKDMLEDSP